MGGVRLPLLLLLLAGSLALVLEHLYRKDVLHAEQMAIETRAISLANALSVALNHRMAMLNGLRAFIEVNWGRPGFPQDFQAYAERLQGTVAGIRAVQWVKDGVIRQTWPEISNERAAGYDLHSDPRAFIREDYLRAERSTGIVISISGPTELVQGGTGVIARMAARDSAGALVAVAAVVLDLPPVLAEAGLGSDPSIRTALRGRSGAVIQGDSLAFAASPALAPVLLPEGEWLLAVLPAGGWLAARAPNIALARGALVLLVLLTSLVGWLISSRAGARAREQDERERRIGEEKFSRLFALSPDGALVIRVDDGIVLAANEGVEAVLGYPREDIVGRPIPDHQLWSNSGDWKDAQQAIREAGGVRSLPMDFTTASGLRRRGLFSARSIEIDGEPCMLVLIRDVTDQKLLAEQLAHAQKLEAVGRLAGGVAHDFNNLITAITGYTDLLRDSLDEDDPRRVDANEILRASSRAAGLTQQLLAFARRQLVQPRVVDLNALTMEVTGMLGRVMGAQVELHLQLAAEPVLALLDPGQFEQLLVNLAVNARDAMPEGGRLTITTRVAETDVVLEVADDGTGMTEEVLAQAFEPFYTTKEAGKGTGLGLATVYGIVQQAGGRVTVSSEAGAGTRFTIVLPRATGPVPEVPPPQAAVALPRGSERILVVEDDAAVRKLLERTLTLAGYEVTAVSGGEEAQREMDAAGAPFHALITDLVMPGMNGQEVARRFRERVPGAVVLMISGYTDDAATREGLVTAGQSFLGKPFTPGELAARVRELLQGSGAPLS